MSTNYPRIANLYAFNYSAQAAAFAKADMVVSNPAAGPNGAVAALKALNSSGVVTCYYDSSGVALTAIDTMSPPIYPQWWLTLAGTTLAAAITDTTGTSVTATAATNITNGCDVLVDGESMHVTNVSGTTLTVTRGFHSTAATHTNGTRIAAHASNWSGVWMMNVTPYCPIDGSSHRWSDYLAAQAAVQLAAYPWDGIFWDNVAAQTNVASGQVDADNNNTADASNGASGTGWADGETALCAALRALAPTTLILGNGVNAGLDGSEVESFEYYAGIGNWSLGFAYWLQLPDASILNPDTNNTGTQSLQAMRYGLATALLSAGYYAYDYGPNDHGQLWSYDEYDNGAGSSLASSLTDTTGTSVALVTGSGSKFSAGNVVHVACDHGAQGDEQMLVGTVTGDTLTVTRGYGGTTATTHVVPGKVRTDAQFAVGHGWLGQPLGPMTSLAALGSNLLTNGGFDVTGGGWMSPWALNFTSGSPVTVSQDTSTQQNGTASLKAIAPSTGNYSIKQIGLSFVSGVTYTLVFWAKGTVNMRLDMIIGQDSSWINIHEVAYTLTGNWARYSYTFTAGSTYVAGQCGVYFVLGYTVGTVWIDNVQFYVGDCNLWRRDFTNGTVLLNATATSQVVTLGTGTFHRISGTQDATTNSGTLVTSVTIPANDGLLLTSAAAARVSWGFLRRGHH